MAVQTLQERIEVQIREAMTLLEQAEANGLPSVAVRVEEHAGES